MQMATKYEVEGIRDRIIKHLEQDWPVNFGDWETVQSRIRQIEGDEDREDFIDLSVPEPASALWLARSYGIHSILPAIFYDLSRIKVDADWSDRHDGMDERDTSWSERTARWHLLTAEDFRDLCIGRERIGKYIANSLETRDSKMVDRCLNTDTEKPSCKRAYWQARSAILSDGMTQHDPLFALVDNHVEWENDEKGKGRFCTNCSATIEGKLEKCRTGLWDKLPDFFNIKKVGKMMHRLDYGID